VLKTEKKEKKKDEPQHKVLKRPEMGGIYYVTMFGPSRKIRNGL
jgi:hypothetical protein